MFIGGLALYILLGVVLWWALNRYIGPQSSTQKGDVVQALALLMAGVAAAIGIYFTWRGQGITQEGQQISRENIETTRQSAEEQVRLTQEGQSTERFTRATEQLAATDDRGNPLLEVRLGAIYELEQVSRISELLRPPILEVLTAYVRRHAAWRDRRGPSEELRETGHLANVDIEAILTVIGRRIHSSEDSERELINLKYTELPHSNGLRGAHLKGADFQEASLRAFDLQRANLQGANLQGANLRRADLQEVHGLTQEMIEWTIGTKLTKLPENLNRPERWSKRPGEQATIVREHIGGG